MTEATGELFATMPIESGMRRRIWLTASAIAAGALLAFVLVLNYVGAEREHDLLALQTRMRIVAESRVAALESWVDQQWSIVGGIGGDESVRLLLTELAQSGGDRGAIVDGEGRLGYLQNYLVVLADRNGFAPALVGPDIRANVRRSAAGGIGLLDLAGNLVTGTAAVPLDPATQLFIHQATRNGRHLRDVFLDSRGQAALAFLQPIYRMQAEASAESQVGWVVGIREIADSLYPLLHQPGVAETTAEAVLVRRRDAVIEYLSPLGGGKAPLSLTLAANTPELDAAAALQAPGGFGIKRDYGNHDVAFISRPVNGTPWLLIYKIDSAEALRDANERQSRLLTGLILGILLISASMVALWRHGASRRATDAANRYQEAAHALDRQRNFLQLVTDSQPNTIAIIGADGRYRFANRIAGEQAGMAAADVVGKSIIAVKGSETAQFYERLDREALETRGPISAVRRVTSKSGPQVLQSHHIPLPQAIGEGNAVLLVEQDITAAVHEHERLEHTLRHLIDNLVALVDRRDPHSAGHSARVARLARAVAGEMGLPPVMMETAEVAASLMNIGKVLVPAEILTGSQILSETEMKAVRRNLEVAAEFLEGIEFDGPVSETLRQSQEQWDGSGPRGLKGAAILPTARIVGLANAFVAMISARAHRPAKSVDEAVKELVESVGRRFDEGSVAALLNYLDNKGGREAIIKDQSAEAIRPPRAQA